MPRVGVYLSTVLDDYSRYIIVRKLCSTRMSPTRWTWHWLPQGAIRLTSVTNPGCSAIMAPATSLTNWPAMGRTRSQIIPEATLLQIHLQSRINAVVLYLIQHRAAAKVLDDRVGILYDSRMILHMCNRLSGSLMAALISSKHPRFRRSRITAIMRKIVTSQAR